MEHKNSESCCHDEQQHEDSIEETHATSSIFSYIQKNTMRMLVIVFAIMVVINIIAMTWFTLSVNQKLDDVLFSTKVQTGTLTFIIPSDCPYCGDMINEKQDLQKQRVKIDNERRLDASSDEAQSLIAKEGIRQLPAMVFASEDEIDSKRITLEEDEHTRMLDNHTIVWEKSSVPFVHADTSTIEGSVAVTYILDKSCTTCYDVVNIQKSALQRFGIVVGQENIVDISDTDVDKLLQKYAIEKVPTVIISPEISAYTTFSQAWQQVGSQEEDGVFVFREMRAIGWVYKDLKTGKTVDTSIKE